MANHPSSFTRRFVFAAAAALLLATACGSSDDPQLGEEERVRFVANRGCSSSTILAVGGTATMRLESATEDPLPGELGVTSETTSVITARLGLEPNTIDLTALKQGDSRIEVTTAGDLLDAIVVSAQPAATVNHATEPRVFLGGSLDVIVNDAFGDCGAEDCRLLGDGFLGWRVEPADRASFLLDFEGVATFRAKSEGQATLFGLEPARKKDVVTHPFEVLAPTAATGLSALLLGLNLDKNKEAALIGLPGKLTRPDAVQIHLMASVMNGDTVPIARRDINWRVEGDELLIEGPTDARDPLNTVFLTTGTGKVMLVAEVPMLTLEQSFEIELTP